MKTMFEICVDQILEDGHWAKYDSETPIHFIVDPKSWPKYSQMDPRTGRGKKKTKRIAGKL